jgi:2'-5' RNA ligase
MPQLFFALWPDTNSTLKLARHRVELARECGGRALRPDALHMTLVFLGSVEEVHIPEVMACADRIIARPFDIVIDKATSFPHTEVAWLGCTAPPQKLFDLQFSLQSQVQQSEFAVDLRPFVPHVTVARHLAHPCPPRGIPPIVWPVRSYSLIESRSNENTTTYAALMTWPLSETIFAK